MRDLSRMIEMSSTQKKDLSRFKTENLVESEKLDSEENS